VPCGFDRHAPACRHVRDGTIRGARIAGLSMAERCSASLGRGRSCRPPGSDAGAVAIRALPLIHRLPGNGSPPRAVPGLRDREEFASMTSRRAECLVSCPSVASPRSQLRGFVRISPDTAPVTRDAADWEHGLWTEARWSGSPGRAAWRATQAARPPLGRVRVVGSTTRRRVYAPRMHELPPRHARERRGAESWLWRAKRCSLEPCPGHGCEQSD
jgi:hypothetical protein